MVFPFRVLSVFDGALGFDREQWFTLLFTFLVVDVPILIAVLASRVVMDRGPLSQLGFQRNRAARRFGFGLLLGGGSILLLFSLSYAMGVALVSGGGGLSVPGFAVFALFLFVVAAAEELLMRGYIITNLLNSTNPTLAAVVSAFIFAVAHALNPSITPIGVLNLTLAGIALAFYYVKSKDLWLPIAAHWLWNLTQGPILGYEISGIRMPSLIAQDPTGPAILSGGDFGIEGSVLTTVILAAAAVWSFRFSRNMV